MSNILSAVLCVLAVFGSSFVWSDNAEDARDAVIKVVDAFRNDIVKDKAILSNNPALLKNRVDNILEGMVDFDDFAKKVMGKYYRRASPEQRIRFASVTRDTLLNTYGSSLLELDPDRINVLPLGPQGRGKEIKVDVDFDIEAGGRLNISFFMERAKEGNWLLSNVVINNINFGLTFRKQFGVMMEQNKNDIELAVDAWRDSLAKRS